jgi:hypothetical protein
MSNPFTNFLSGVGAGLFGNSPQMKDYKHASRLYVADTYARAPKLGFLYFVSFNLKAGVIKDKEWLEKYSKNVGLLVKKIDLPKFTITTETLNQYNRKTVIQTKLNYGNINIDFHDDNSDITTNLWKNYYKYYFADSNYGDSTSGKLSKGQLPIAFTDTKYGTTDNNYGLNNNQSSQFFDTIDIYVLHQHKFTQVTLINPIVTDWAHDGVSQDEGNKILGSKMTVAYENVIYSQGNIKKDANKPENFAAIYYDTSPSPLGIGGNGTNTLFGGGGVIAGATGVFGALTNAKSPLDFLGVAIQANSLAKNVKQLSKAGLQTEGYSILTGVLGTISSTGNQPGGAGQQLKDAINTGNAGALGNLGINLFSGQNSSVNGLTQATTALAKKLTGN